MKTILIATTNPAKAAYYRRVLARHASQVLTLQDAGISVKPVEHGHTAEENAEIKARFYAARSGLPALSEDAALYVDFFCEAEQPGVHVRRIDGQEEASDDELLAHWEQRIAAIPPEQRTGRWHVACCLATPAGEVHTTALDYPLVFFSPPSPVRIPGWPLSSLEGAPEAGKPRSEMTEEERRIANERTERALELALEKILMKAPRTFPNA